MAVRWKGAGRREDAENHTNFFTQLADRLKTLHRRHQQDCRYHINVAEYDEQYVEKGLSDWDANESTIPTETAVQSGPSPFVRNSLHSSLAPMRSGHYPMNAQVSHDSAVPQQSTADGDELSAISRILMDQSFTEMDRVISFENMNFNSQPNDLAAGFSNQWNNIPEGLQETGGWPPIYGGSY